MTTVFFHVDKYDKCDANLAVNGSGNLFSLEVETPDRSSVTIFLNRAQLEGLKRIIESALDEPGARPGRTIATDENLLRSLL